MNTKITAPRTSSPMHYFAKAEGLPGQILCVRLMATPACTRAIGARK